MMSVVLIMTLTVVTDCRGFRCLADPDLKGVILTENHPYFPLNLS